MDIEVTWKITINEKLGAQCDVQIDVQHPAMRLGTVDTSHQIIFPLNIPLSSPDIKINGRTFSNCCHSTRTNENNIFEINLVQLNAEDPTLFTLDTMSICLQTQLENIVKKFGVGNIFHVEMRAKCAKQPLKTSYIITLPQITNKFYQLLNKTLSFIAWIIRVSEDPRRFYEINTSAESPNYDYKKGVIEYSTTEFSERGPVLIAYNTRSEKQSVWVIFGAIIGVILTAVVSELVKLIFQ